MNFTKKILLGLVTFGLAVSAYASPLPQGVVTPRDQRGNEANPLYGGFANTRVFEGTNERIVCSGRCVLAALILNTGPQTSQVRIRNSSVANGAGMLALKYNYTILNTEPGNNPVRLPMLFDKGITVQLTAVGAQEEVVVEYIDMD